MAPWWKKGTDGSSSDLTPEEEQAWHAGLERVVEERAAALRDPGPSWREWFFFQHLKWWYGLTCLIVDSWALVGWIHNGTITPIDAVGAALSVAAALYLEFLFYRYLWYRPDEEAPQPRGTFRPSWTGLTEVGRWTPEAAERRKYGAGRSADGTPAPREFL